MSTFQKEQLVWTQNAWISENKYSVYLKFDFARWLAIDHGTQSPNTHSTLPHPSECECLGTARWAVPIKWPEIDIISQKATNFRIALSILKICIFFLEF